MCEIIVAGFGGQGVLAAGIILANAGMKADLNTTWLPAYGGEQRGGTANCSVKLSKDEVGSPFVEDPDVLLAFNQPSFDKFEKAVRPGGFVFVNSSLITREAVRSDVNVIRIDATQMAAELGNARAANSIMLGALIGRLSLVPADKAEEALNEYFAQKSEKAAELNRRAFKLGMDHTAAEEADINGTRIVP